MIGEVKLNPEQRKAVEHGKGPLLIIAGAGTGKTTVVTQRIEHLISKGLAQPEEILALTFTEKATSEMTERVDNILPLGYSEMWISTFHSFCDMILRLEGLEIGLNPSYRLLTEAESILLLRKNLFKLQLDYYRPLGNPTKFLEALLQHFSRLSDEDVTPSEYESFVKKVPKEIDADGEIFDAKQLKELSLAYTQYSEIKAREGFMDFSDLVSNVLKLFRERPNVLKKYQNKFKYILVDEFQDTNFSQNKLAILLAGESKNITVVADDDQAIYRWRGAAISNVIQFRKNFPGAKIISLTRNYRSTQKILDSAYLMIQNNNPNRLEYSEKISKKLTSERNIKGGDIEFIQTTRLDEEAEKIAEKITELVKSGNYTYKDIAILVRANNHAHPITNFLQRQKIPFQFLGPSQLFQQEAIKDLIAYLKVLTDVTDDVSLFRVLSMSIFEIPQLELNYLLGLAKKNNLTLFESIEQIKDSYIKNDTQEKLAEIRKLIISHVAKSRTETAGQILYYFLVESGIYEQLLNYKNQQEEKSALSIAKFFDRLKNFEYSGETTGIYPVVEWIDLMTQLGDSPIVSDTDFKEFDAVNVLTVHSSKGLEFPIVFVVNLVVERFPGRDRKEKIPLPKELIKTETNVKLKNKKEIEIVPTNYHLQEERRLFYVAMTRARDQLFLTAASFYGEGKREKKISPFVFEAIPHAAVKKVTSTKAQQLTLLDVASHYTSVKQKEQELTTHEVKSISFSQLQSFDVCPLHYKARYILGIPTPPSAAQSFGISLHTVLAEYSKKSTTKKKMSKEELLEILDTVWTSQGFSNKEHEKEAKRRAIQIVSSFYDKEVKDNIIPEQIEMPFAFYLKNKLRVTGKIDRIDRLPDGTLEIIDYKTGNIDSAIKSSYKFQLGIYALAAERINHPLFRRGEKNKILLSLFYIESGKKITTEITDKELKAIEEKIIEKVKAIEVSDFLCSKNLLCKNCEYRLLCTSPS